jgi:hypothetical protein
MTPQNHHSWEATGVTGYPITHPIVGQRDFHEKFRSYLQLVAGADNRFAHVFAVVAPWGVGKSRLGYEIVAQVNDSSKGWMVRAPEEGLVDARIFDEEQEREQYLSLYIRYSQVADRALNLDNWFAPAVYKALTPLARTTFDSSIQHQIAKQAHARLLAEGFDPQVLAAAMELGEHDESIIYSDTGLATRLCNAAFDTLRPFGIRYVVLVLDELETAAERATSGMEAEETRGMDGRAITMLKHAVENIGTLDRKGIETVSKAVKEEDARARFPWLRFVVLCSPAIGDELKEVQSTDRRFEIVDLDRNAFSDVRTFVQSLESEGRLLRPYPPGLVEAAYMMSGGNFGWFNVVMAVVDQVLQRHGGTKPMTAEAVFRRAIEVSNRIATYVLDRRTLDEIEVAPEKRPSVERLLYGQVPLPLSEVSGADALLAAKNAHGEPIALRFRRATWTVQQCTQILIRNRFVRLPGTSKWTAPGIPEAIDLERMLDDLATLAVREPVAKATGAYALLLPATQADFLQLLDLIHPHPASEEVGRVLWNELVGHGSLQELATHLGPSVEMLRRLDIRLRKANIGAVLRDPDENAAYMSIIDALRLKDDERSLHVLTGAMRLMDESWTYDADLVALGGGIAIRTLKGKGLVDFKGAWLHPKGTAVLAYAAGDAQLIGLVRAVAKHQRTEGRYPVVVLTGDYDLPERFEQGAVVEYTRARDHVVVVHVNSGEETALLGIGLSSQRWKGFRLRREGFTTRFAERLNRIKAPIARRVRTWRQGVTARGGIAWPLRPSGTLKPEALKQLVDGWQRVMLTMGSVALEDAGDVNGLDFSSLISEIDKLGLSPAAAPRGYSGQDSAGLWRGEGGAARPQVPPFLLTSVIFPLITAHGRTGERDRALELASVRTDWLWGYTWDGNRPGDIFREWMVVACQLGWARHLPGSKKHRYMLIPRSELHGRLTEARNWLEDTYPKVYAELAVVLGESALKNHFKPGSGTKYVAAIRDLDDAKVALTKLDVLEGATPAVDDPTATATWFIDTTRLRLQASSLIAKVFDKDAYEALPADLDRHTLHLLDEEQPLWKRMRWAEHFSHAVRATARRIRKRIPTLRDELIAGVVGIFGFPIALFTRPFLKIEHIIDHGMTGEDPDSTTQRVQHAKVDTLAWYLKELRVADAMDALERLAREAGVGLVASDDRSIEDIEGEIVQGYSDLRDRMATARTAVVALAGRIHAVEDALDGPPADFRLPSGASLSQVSGRPALIEAQLDESLLEDVEDLLDRHDDAMNLGKFGPLMREARQRLLDSAEQAIKGLEGRTRTLENAVQSYRQSLLDSAELHRTRRALNALRRVAGDTAVVSPTLDELVPRSLSEGAQHITATVQGWSDNGEILLEPTHVSFATWVQVLAAVAAHDDLPVSSTQADALVAHGFLRRVYALPGGPA